VVETLYSSARDMALAGAFVANTDGSTSIAINPAGIAPRTKYDIRMAELSLAGTLRRSKVHETDKHTSQLYGFYWMSQKENFSWGLGLYDNAVYELRYFDDQNKLNKMVVSGYDMSLAYAYALSESLKIGVAVKLSNLGPNDNENKKTKDEDDPINFKLGGQYNLLNGYIDLQQTSLSFNCNTGLSYQPEITASLSNLAKTHPLYEREVTLLPESYVLGTHLQFAWLTRSLSMVFNINGDYKNTRYSNMGELFFPGTKASQIEIQEQRLGFELLVSQQKQSNSYAIRAGIAKQHSKSHFAFDENTFALGLGWSNGKASIDIAHLLSKPSTFNRYSSDRSQTNLTISFTL
jgi:hypothetical protein